MQKTPTILIIFGVSGDLARRHLLPALEELKSKNLLPEQFELVGVSRKEYGDEYEKLNDNLLKIEEKFGAEAQRIFYLAVPTNVCPAIIELIGKSNLKTKQTKILLEKPFGFNLKSAEGLVDHVNKYFTEEQVYRVDHYMLKDGTQEMLTSRRENPIFKNKWNKDFIESIEIVASEKIGIEGRVNFYEQTGALIDFLQNHLLELAALTLMDYKNENSDIPNARLNALRELNVVCDITKSECVKRGQYEGYREEVSNPKSMTETFVSVNLRSSDTNWTGVPITLTTGKALKEKFTEINIRLKDKSLHNLFGKNSNSYEKVLLNAINSDRTFFSGSEEILETWRILDEIQQTWASSKDDLVFYKKGSTIDEV